jgi:glutamyl-tRNA reductase
MSVVLIGLSHHTAPLDVREHYAVPTDRWVALDEKLARLPDVSEAALISTCNRTEVVATSESPDRALLELGGFLRRELGDPEHARFFYELRERAALEHLFVVCASLDSMVVGENQILGQVKRAYGAAVEAGACGPVLNRLFQGAFHAAKRVRTETGIGAGSVSVARVGVQLARELFESFADKRVLLVGAGEMAESALLGFREAGASEIVVLNRTEEAARRLAARVGAQAAPLDALVPELSRAHVALTSVAMERPLIDAALLRETLAGRHGNPLLLVDLALPRNVDPEVDALDDVYLYNLDDLDQVAERGREERRQATLPARELVRAECERFERWEAGLEVVPVIQRLLQLAQSVADEELRRTLAQLPERSPELEARLRRMSEAMFAKLLHGPLRALRREAEQKAAPYYADALRTIFGLDDEGDPEE